MGEPKEQVIHEFGGFRLDPARRRLCGADGRPLAVRAKVFDTLLYLVEHSGDLVQKDELIRAVWPHAVVEENNLNQAVSTLRRLLHDDRLSPRFIATVPGRGYQFVAEVRSGARAPQPETEESSASVTPASAETEQDHTALQSTATEPAVKRYVPFAAMIGFAIAGVVLTAYVLTVASGPESGSGMLVNQQLVSNFPGSHRSPTPSPDGTMLAFVSDASGTDQLWIKSLTGGDPIEITDGEATASRPAWSPRNDQILFSRPGDGIWTVGTLGTPGPRRVIENGHNPGFSWDGSTIVYERGREIWLANADGSGQRRVEGVPFRRFFNVSAWPSLSPDGKHIAFFHSEAAIAGDIWVVPSAGGEARRLTFDTVPAGSPVWSADGRHILYASMRSGTRTLWRIAADGGEPEPVTSGVGEDSEPTITRDGRRLLYTNTRTTWRLMSSDAKTSRHVVLHEGRYPIRLPDVSPDGESVAFFSDRIAGTHIFVIDRDGSDLRQLTFAEGGQTLPYWSADGRSIYFFSGPPALALQKISSEGGSATQVIADFHWSTGRTWAAERPGGESIAFVDWDFPDFSENRTVVRSLATGAEATLSRPALLGPDWSRDGSAVLGYRLGEGLIMCEVATPESCRSISTNGDPFPGTHPRWSNDESHIFFLRSEKDKPQIHELWVVGRNGESALRLFEVGPIASSDVQFAVARNDRIVWAQYDRGDDEIWMARLRN